MSDLIKREDAEKIVTHCKGLHGSYVDDICEKLEALPSAERKGEWIQDNYEFVMWRCSECGDMEFKKTNYCPHCGARMKGAEGE